MTREGELLFKCCQKISTQLDECLFELQNNKLEKSQLILSCEPTISMKWLIPRLVEFKQIGYDFDIILLTGGGVVDFENNHIDIAIRRNDFDWGEHIFSEKIVDEYIVMVQTPQLTRNTDLLISISRPNFFKNLNKLRPFTKILQEYSKIELEHFYLCLEGCLAGLGATIISIYMIEKELSWNFLEKNTPVINDGSSYYLLSHRDFEEDPRKLLFLEWLKKEMTKTLSAHI